MAILGGFAALALAGCKDLSVSLNVEHAPHGQLHGVAEVSESFPSGGFPTDRNLIRLLFQRRPLYGGRWVTEDIQATEVIPRPGQDSITFKMRTAIGGRPSGIWRVVANVERHSEGGGWKAIRAVSNKTPVR